MNKLITVKEEKQRSKHTHMELGGGETERSSLKAGCKMWLNSTFLSYTRTSFIMAVSFFFFLSGERTGFAVKQSNVRIIIKLCGVGQVSLLL